MTFFSEIYWLFSDVYAMTKRNLVHYKRLPQLLILTLVQPLIFLFLFTYVFGGAIKIPGGSYINFIMPALFVQTMVFGAIQTGVGVAEDISRGVMDRFRSLPMARGGMLAGRAMGDMVRNVFIVFLIGIIGYFIGFHFTLGIGNAIIALAIIILFGVAFSWVAVAIGLLTKNSEAAQMAGLIIMFPIFFASSALVPLQTLPVYLRQVAQFNPVTSVIDVARILFHGGVINQPLLYTFVWIFVLFVIFVPFSVWLYQRIGR